MIKVQFPMEKAVINTPTLKEYHGSDYVIYNRSCNCIKGIEEPMERAIVDDCSITNHRDPKIQSWHSLFSTNDIYKYHNSTAVKRGFSFNYVYCFPWKISLPDGNYRCPPSVFKLRLNVSFVTADYNYHPVLRKFNVKVDDLQFVDQIHRSHFADFSNAINDAAMFDELQRLRRELDQIHIDEDKKYTVVKHSPTYYILLVHILILLLFSTGAGAFLLRVYHVSYNILANDVVEIKHIYGSTTCLHCSQSMAQTTTLKNEDSKVDIAANRSVNVTFNCPPTRRLPEIPTQDV